jgi:hypothetical protein
MNRGEVIMASKKTVAAAAVVLITVSMIAAGCGVSGPDLIFNRSAKNPVIVLRYAQALAPLYNPNAPAAIYYGDGTVVLKKDSYSYTSGKLAEGGLDETLKKISDQGFFEMKSKYTGAPVPGGKTSVLQVKLKEKSYEVTVESGAGPKGWNEIMTAVTKPELPKTSTYYPPAVHLHATPFGAAEEGTTVKNWPSNAGDLAKVGDAPRGSKISGNEAENAWKAIGGTVKGTATILWRYKEDLFGNVYAAPIFTGVPE